MIHHFYHIYANGQWQVPVSEHVRALKMGLYNELKTFAIGIVGNDHACEVVKDYLRSEGLNFQVVAQQNSGWEQVTQIPMWDFTKHNDGVVLYAHSKGSANQNDVNTRWRRSMIYWNVINYKECLEKLKEVDAVGCHWIYPLVSMPEHRYGNPMFAGTFWWARCDLVRTFDQPPLNHRHEAEGWIGYKYVQEPFKVHDYTPYFPNGGPFKDDWI